MSSFGIDRYISVRAELVRQTSGFQVLRPNPVEFSHFLYKFVLNSCTFKTAPNGF